ncbi:MAG: DUF3343 domain-containing protein [Clostridium sp.]
MRKKERKLIITFHTTADAIATERACKEAQLEGRMIPVPREVSAGCGLAWCTVPELKDQTICFLSERNVEWEDIVELMY